MTTTTAPTLTPVERPAATRTPRVRFRDLVAAEWIKLWSLRSTKWSFLAAAFVVLGENLLSAWGDYSNYPDYSAKIKAVFVPYWALGDAFNDGSAFLLVIAAGAIGANLVVNEYGTRLIRTTFAAVPARRSVMAAKVVLATGVFVVFGALIVGVSFWADEAILSLRHAGLSIGYPGALRVTVAAALLAPIAALIGMAIGAVVRHPATTMVLLIVLNVVVPALLLDQRRLSATIDEAMPITAWARLPAIGDQTGPGPIGMSMAHAWIVYAAWAVVSVIVTVVVPARRDV
ncbi:ABC transporter permease [Rugosimonospora africana]|uniref:ABC transporter permease n=1 Tax=Rugosimonospora africana TaxID=556532 RepID=A0A8J3R075_9ACTN|nr:ABC transporter permease [Rugosimonospora africana]GIH20580.1 ABC transporter permease [Rugosimonospora africana]